MKKSKEDGSIDRNKKTKKSSKGKKNKKQSKVKVFFKILLVLILLVIIGYAIWFGINYAKHFLAGKKIEYDPLSATALGIDPEKLKNVGRINVLILGESGIPGDDYKLTDSIMVASYNPQTQQASLLSIPRDTYVGKKDRNSASANYLASYKMNAVYRNGTNIEETVDRVSDLIGLEINNYVLIDTDAIKDIVDAIGGVWFNVPIDMNYDDYNQDLHIHLTAGEQLIDGDKAEQLLRFRHNQDYTSYSSEYGDNDLGRMRTQREFIQATLKQLIKFENITKVLDLLNIVYDNVKTDLTMETMKYYIPYAFKFNMENIKSGMVPGESEKCNGIWLYVADKKETKKLSDELFKDIVVENPNADENSSENNSETNYESNTKANSEGSTNGNTKSNTKNGNGTDNTNNGSSTDNTKNTAGNNVANKEIKVEILNGTSSSAKIEEVKKKLTNAGYKVTKTGGTTETANSLIINRTMQSSLVEDDVKEILGIKEVHKSSNNSNVDLTIIIGKDY